MYRPHFTIHPFAPLRAEASDTAEMVSQLMFGDMVEILAEDRQWRHVRNQADAYEGWVDHKALVEVDETWLSSVTSWSYLFADSLKAQLKHDNGVEVLPLILGARIPQIAGTSLKELDLGGVSIAFPQDYEAEANWAPHQIAALSAKYLGTPYLWGGKSLAGIDCSGLTQMVYAMCGIQLPRDAAQQVEIGTEVDFEARKEGDLAYFAKPGGKVTHVGIVLAGNEIRHAAGNVHDDLLNSEGIQRKYTGKQTHRLVSIKRIF